ncbi:hypothetical protein KSC_010270 [Ktedonobacter sp. SOSP1-52]|uniref:hypothetical protein n=1 Tax=Ktedonobacter sp. SOSP1-52 TaxID=2778366 RepID=UPI001916BD71|nr:hypothetical protein [Ktedonobacter sp. SOSP1-52]GHO62135.1 hypothetical protein KSC_010270 [Ktedonobacter sp. SOSP1-52]
MSPYSYDDDFYRQEEEWQQREYWRRQEAWQKQEELHWEELRKQEELLQEEEQHKQEELYMEEKKHIDDEYYQSLANMRYDEANKESTGIESFYFAKRPQRSVGSANDGSFIFLLVVVLVALLLYFMYTGSLHF